MTDREMMKALWDIIREFDADDYLLECADQDDYAKSQAALEPVDVVRSRVLSVLWPVAEALNDTDFMFGDDCYDIPF